MTTVKQHLWFASDMARAVTTYTSLIPDSAIEWMSPIGADTPMGPILANHPETLGRRDERSRESPACHKGHAENEEIRHRRLGRGGAAPPPFLKKDGGFGGSGTLPPILASYV